jgi:hypothetical protein
MLGTLTATDVLLYRLSSISSQNRGTFIWNIPGGSKPRWSGRGEGLFEATARFAKEMPGQFVLGAVGTTLRF